MPTRDRLDAFVEAVTEGCFVEAMRDFYHEDAVTRENLGPERRGLATLIAIEEAALRTFRIKAAPPVAVVLDGDDVAIHWIFEMTSATGDTRRLEEIALQRWRGDRIQSERFFYDPSLPVLGEG